MEWYHYLIVYFVFLIVINIIINIITIKIGYYQIMKTIDNDQVNGIKISLTITFIILTFVTDFILEKFFKIDISNFLFVLFFTLLLFTPKLSKIIYIHDKRKNNKQIPHKPKEIVREKVDYYEKFFKKKDDKNKKDKEKEELEKEMNLYNLEEWEKEEVRKGNFRPENFEDSEGINDLEDDDYHFEDD